MKSRTEQSNIHARSTDILLSMLEGCPFTNMGLCTQIHFHKPFRDRGPPKTPCVLGGGPFFILTISTILSCLPNPQGSARQSLYAAGHVPCKPRVWGKQFPTHEPSASQEGSQEKHWQAGTPTAEHLLDAFLLQRPSFWRSPCRVMMFLFL